MLDKIEHHLLDNLSGIFNQYDSDYFQKSKLDQAKLAKESESWLSKTNKILEDSVMMSLENKGAIPFKLVDSEEIDKILIIADSLVQKTQ